MQRNGRSTRVGARFAFGLLGICWWVGGAQAGDDLASIRSLAQQGAPQLAERLLIGGQPSRRSAPAAWFEWERARLDLLKLQGRSGLVEARLREILAEPVSAAVATWALDELATAELLANRNHAALKTLRRLLWNGEPPTDVAAIARWQRQIATAYLRLGQSADAGRVMMRYDAGAESGSDEGAMLRARIALREGDLQTVPQALVGVVGAEADILRWAAVVRADEGRERDVLKAATELAVQTRLGDDERQQALALMAEAAAKAGHLPGRISALERLFDTGQASAELEGVFDLSIAQLWTTYVDYGRQVADAWQLPAGDDAHWLRVAQAARSESPFAARGLYGLLLSDAKSLEVRAEAALGLIDTLVNKDQGRRLVLRLFSTCPAFPDIAAMPLALRYRLIDLAIAENDVPRAAAWSTGLDEPPSSRDAFDWRLRQARVLLLGGRDNQAIALLLGLVRDPALAERALRDRFLQVVFDLQAAGQHRPAIELFQTLMTPPQDKSLDAKQRRELWYWIGDSYKALEDPIAAARAYLASAAEPDPYAMDPWAQSARYQAAEQLAAAGLFDDALGIYVRLLGVTHDPARRVMLQGRIQKLRLKAGGSKS